MASDQVMRIVVVLISAVLLLSAPLSGTYAAQDAPAIDGEMLFQARCALCHQLPEPAMLKARQWQLIINTMQKRMQHVNMVPLTEDEKTQLIYYLSQHARQ